MRSNNSTERAIFNFYTQLFRAMGSFSASLSSNYEVTTSQARVLGIIDQKPGLTLKEIVKAAHLNKGNCSSLCNTLAEKGLIERFRQSEDRRRVEHTLTAQGREVLDMFYKNLLHLQKPIFKELTEEEQDKLVESLQTVTRYLEQVENLVEDRLDF